MDSTDDQCQQDAIPRLTVAAAEGDEPAFRQLFDLYYGRVYRYALVATSGDEAQSQEIAQEIFLRLHRHLQPFASDERLWFWLTRVARSVLVDSSRIRTRQLKLKHAFEEHAAVETSPDTDAGLLPILASCLDDLTADERQLVERFYFNRQSVQQISEALGTTFKSVESKLSRTRAKLRQNLLGKINRE